MWRFFTELIIPEVSVVIAPCHKLHVAGLQHQLRAEEAGEHLAVIEALRSGDGKEAARAMSRHIKSGVRYWTRALPAVVNGRAT